MSRIVTCDPVKFAQDLIRKPSITPVDAGALDVLQNHLENLGFACTRYPFGEGEDRVDNLYARLGTAAPNFCFAGHTDVVPVGDEGKWDSAPFDAALKNGELWGRGAADMKGAIAAFVAALTNLLAIGWKPSGSISFLITGDEEGPAVNGTDKLLKAITKAGEVIDHCLVGEPTNPDALGDMIKNGRRGSLNAKLTVKGQQGHVAYPHRASNPLPTMITLLSHLQERHLDDGNDFFQPSNLEVTSIDVGNTAHNVIPEEAHAKFNIRFNTEHRGDDLKDWIQKEVAAIQSGYDGVIEADLRVTGEAFLTDPCSFTDTIQSAVEEITERRPELSTSGGTSDARYITHYAPVVEFGLVGATMHQFNERVAISDIETLTEIYSLVLRKYFS
ncbi:MAG: succinyl-diaminopimelate desuccinylase [Hellea sp.]|nr:succinyl-diaminopimelate desuccinylase [Hellea sp.]